MNLAYEMFAHRLDVGQHPDQHGALLGVVVGRQEPSLDLVRVRGLVLEADLEWGCLAVLEAEGASAA